MSSGVTLQTEVRFVRGVGPVRAQQFARLGVRTVGDLIEYFPFRHELAPKSQPIGTLQLGQTATVVGSLDRLRRGGRFSKATVTGTVVDGTGRCNVRWFNSPYVLDRLRQGSILRLTGKVELYRNSASFSNPAWLAFEDGEDALADDHDRYDPVYRGTNQLSSRQIARVISLVLEEAVEAAEEILPSVLRRKRRLPPRRSAIVRYHKPTAGEDVPVARGRLAYDELLLCRLAVEWGRRRRAEGPAAMPISVTPEMDQRIRNRFPFALTDGQNRVISEICHDLAGKVAMNRLLQGDVGSGKTAVAVYAALAAVANRCQVVFLAPTEVLVAQHEEKISRFLKSSRVRIAVLTGSTNRAPRARLLSALANGGIDLLIGTHALFEPDVSFKKLGLLLIDEQHKFGVAQRNSLRSKGRAPHTLALTATPIPRSLAMTAFGDHDLSKIVGLPPGRQTVATRVVKPEQVSKAWTFVNERLDRGERAYVIYPLIDENEDMPLQAVTVEAKRLTETVLCDGKTAVGPLCGRRVGLMHGRLKPSEKASVMARFRSGELQVLVSTTVVEVGLDVPEATVMLIQHAERFGLSQLHQLRGRVGRSSHKSYCLLFSTATGDQSERRLEILSAETDGFRIAEMDLVMRGAGELLGTRQHGLPMFKVVDLATDLEWLELAKHDAIDILRDDPNLTLPRHKNLRRALMRDYGDRLGFIDT